NGLNHLNVLNDLNRRLRRGLEFIFLERLEGGRAASERVVPGHPVEDVNAAVVEEGRLGDRPAGGGGAHGAAPERSLANALQRLEAVTSGAFVLVERHACG